jgi:hypothetical protein
MMKQMCDRHMTQAARINCDGWSEVRGRERGGGCLTSINSR